MVAKKDKKAQKRGDIEIRTSNIFVVNAQKYRPYIESFSETPTNFTKQKMGTLLGFFYISDFSPESENVVNFLTSTVKKEYFANTRRNVTDSFEAALHHVNCALAETAKNGNIGWLGNIDAALCVIDRHMIHFSVTGEARILLIRDGVITDISEGLASKEAVEHPLKTFADIASGELKEGDKVIIATPELSSLFSIEEIQRYADRFSHKKFLQFIDTALVNKCHVASTFIFDVCQKEITPPPTIRKSNTAPEEELVDIDNVFGSKNFQEQQISNGHQDTHNTTPIPTLTEKDSWEKKDTDYVDEKTGHIYITGENDGAENTPLAPIMSHIKDFYDDTKYATKKTSKSAYTSSKASVKNTFQKASRHSSLLFKKNTAFLAKKIAKTQQENTTKTHKKSSHTTTSLPSEKLDNEPPITFVARVKDTFLDIVLFIKKLVKQITKFLHSLLHKKSTNNAKVTTQNKSYRQTPKITHIYHHLSVRQKYATFAIILGIILMPLLIHKVNGLLQKEEIVEEEIFEESITNISQPSSDRSFEESITNIDQSSSDQTIDDGNTLFTKEGVTNIHTLDNIVLTTTDTAVILWKNGKQSDFKLPDNAGTIINTTIMSDLDLLFIHTDKNKLYAFSLIDQKFTENIVNFPDTVSDIETYSTYLYVIDTSEKQIYRYPRITNGFGDRSTWLKDSADVDFANFVDMAVNEDLYVVTNAKLNSYSRGKKNNTSFDTSDATIAYLSSVQDATYIYILDQENARLLQITKDGSLDKEWVHKDFADAKGFSIDEENNKAFFTINNKIKEFSL